MPDLFLPVVHSMLAIAWRARLVAGRLVRMQLRGAQAVVVHEASVLLIQNSYRAGYYLPGGGLRSGENPQQTAARELREETGIVVESSDLIPVGVCDYAIKGTPVLDWIYRITLPEARRPRIDRVEVVSAEFVDISRARQLACQPHVQEIIETLGKEFATGNAAVDTSGLPG